MFGSARNLLAVFYCLIGVAAQAETVIDLSGYRADCEVRVAGFNGHLIVTWPTGGGDDAEVALDMNGDKPLIERLSMRKGQDLAEIFGGVDPVWFLTVGERRARDEKSPEQKWEVFFDNPQRRPHETFASTLVMKQARVTGSGKRATVAIDELTVGPFAGSVELSFYAGSRLMRIDAAIKTDKDRLAVFYDTGLVAERPSWDEIGWVDTEGGIQKHSALAGVPAISSPGPFSQRESGQTPPQAV